MLSGKTPTESVPALRKFQVEQVGVIQVSNLANRANSEFFGFFLLFSLMKALFIMRENEGHVLRLCLFNVQHRIRCSNSR